MNLLGTPVNKLQPADIDRLLTGKIQESRTLDYKRELNLSQDKDRKEFLYDIAAMSNTEGGCLIYGINELLDDEGQNTGIPDSVVGVSFTNIDKLVQQIEDLVQTCTDPKITGLEIQHINISDLIVLVIGVPKNFGLPIMVTFKGSNKFYKRRNTGKYPVDVLELSAMFSSKHNLKSFAENFRQFRIEKSRSYGIFPNLHITGGLFIHVIPYNFDDGALLDLSELPNDVATKMRPIGQAFGYNALYNFDGYVTYKSRQNLVYSYCQLFRSGAYEVFSSDVFHLYKTAANENIFHANAQDLCKDILEQFNFIAEITRIFDVQSPFMVSISFINIKNAVISYGTNWSKPFMSEDLILPAVLVPSFDADYKSRLRPLFDIIWQSVGESRCRYFPE
jgi:hypothetical protein